MIPKKSHLDLFSGIGRGGFALAASWAGYTSMQFVEIDPYCRRVLARHWPEVPIHHDIRSFNAHRFAGTVDLLTGGFPCQPYSSSGKRRGAADDRALWPEMRRIIHECKPAWIVGENVAGFIAMALDDALADLEAEGYETRAFVLPACAIGAPHRRDRVWIVARNTRCHESAANGSLLTKSGSESGRGGASNAPEPPLQHCFDHQSELDRIANGVPHQLDRIRALGNAIVPGVAYEIIRAIRCIEAESQNGIAGSRRRP